MNRILKSAAVLSTLLALGAISLDASAQSIRVRCESGGGRSKASVDGNDLATGSYKARIVSGANRADSKSQPSSFGEVEFDFDSNPKDIAAGATPIASNFIVRNRVTGTLFDSRGRTVATQTATCKVR